MLLVKINLAATIVNGDSYAKKVQASFRPFIALFDKIDMSSKLNWAESNLKNYMPVYRYYTTGKLTDFDSLSIDSNLQTYIGNSIVNEIKDNGLAYGKQLE